MSTQRLNTKVRQRKGDVVDVLYSFEEMFIDGASGILKFRSGVLDKTIVKLGMNLKYCERFITRLSLFPFSFQGVKDVNWMNRAEKAKVCTVRKIVYCTVVVLPSLRIHTLKTNMIKYVNK